MIVLCVFIASKDLNILGVSKFSSTVRSQISELLSTPEGNHLSQLTVWKTVE